MRLGARSAKTVLESETRWASRVAKESTATVSEDKSRVTDRCNYGLASLAVKLTAIRTGRYTTDTVAAVVGQIVRAFGSRDADASVSLKTGTLRTHRRVREYTASAVVNSSNGTTATVAGRILSRDDMAQVDSAGRTTTRIGKLTSTTVDVTSYRRWHRPRLLNHEASIEWNLGCCTTQR